MEKIAPLLPFVLMITVIYFSVKFLKIKSLNLKI